MKPTDPVATTSGLINGSCSIHLTIHPPFSADGLNIEDDEPPPEPAPPEIPPRGHSLLRSTSTSLRRVSDYQIHVGATQKHEEFIPQEKQQGE